MSSSGMSATSAAVYTRFTGISPVVKNCSLRSACFFRKAATSFFSQSATSLDSVLADFGSSILFMMRSLGFSSTVLCLEKFVRQRIGIRVAVDQARGEGHAAIRERAAEAFEQKVFCGLAQAELCDRELASTANLGLEGDRAVLFDRGDEIVQALAGNRTRADDWR